MICCEVSSQCTNRATLTLSVFTATYFNLATIEVIEGWLFLLNPVGTHSAQSSIHFTSLVAKMKMTSRNFLTLSLLGYLKTRICWAPPPSKSHVWCPNMTNDSSLESSCALLLESEKNLQICKNWIFITKSSYVVKMFAKKICPKNENYTFLKSPWPCHFKYAKIFAKF